MKIVLYHGTDRDSEENIVNNGIDVDHNPRGGDFGVGFYLTPNLEIAKQMALRKTFTGLIPEVVEMTLDKDFQKKVKVKDLGVLSLASSDEKLMQWAQFIVNNRCGMDYVLSVSSKHGLGENNLDKRYDIVLGSIADGKITKISRLCKKEKRIVTLNEAKDFLDKYYGLQYCINTEKGLSAIADYPRKKKGVSWR